MVIIFMREQLKQNVRANFIAISHTKRRKKTAATAIEIVVPILAIVLLKWERENTPKYFSYYRLIFMEKKSSSSCFEQQRDRVFCCFFRVLFSFIHFVRAANTQLWLTGNSCMSFSTYMHVREFWAAENGPVQFSFFFFCFITVFKLFFLFVFSSYSSFFYSFYGWFQIHVVAWKISLRSHWYRVCNQLLVFNFWDWEYRSYQNTWPINLLMFPSMHSFLHAVF